MTRSGIVLRRWGYALLGWAVTAYSAAYEPAPFSRYQPILDRMPFGALPPTFNPAAADLEAQKNAEQLQAEQQQVAKQIAFTALNITPRGRTAVGFIDRSTNPPESFYLEVGASARGWTVIAADYDDEWAQFQKDGVTITMHLDKGLIDGPPSETAAAVSNAVPVVAAAVEPPAAAPPVAVPGLVRLPAAARAAPSQPASTMTSAKSYLERLRERKAQEKAEQHAAEKATRESLQELARKIAQDEMAKREKENEATLQQLHAQQELLNAQQELEAQAQMPEHTPEEMPAPDAVPAPEAVPEEQ
ncbi:MAG: hypothetical protein BWX70_00346 [Verrucomicrobia bacterium ADurb.Bin070]|nr:MAG: hypothetical protein BWX70_00346 [Verrucomicrobia bacterium ADurb.Bin070]